MAEKGGEKVTKQELTRVEAGLATPGQANIGPRVEGNLAVEDALQGQSIAKANKALEQRIKEGKL